MPVIRGWYQGNEIPEVEKKLATVCIQGQIVALAADEFTKNQRRHAQSQLGRPLGNFAPFKVQSKASLEALLAALAPGSGTVG